MILILIRNLSILSLKTDINIIMIERTTCFKLHGCTLITQFSYMANNSSPFSHTNKGCTLCITINKISGEKEIRNVCLQAVDQIATYSQLGLVNEESSVHFMLMDSLPLVMEQTLYLYITPQ